jgi:hypothetical protein
MTNLEAALKYSERGLSIIPVGKNKRPLLKWEPFQKTKADEIQIRAWFKKWPNANIGIVTGKISGITVADADSEDAYNLLNEYLPETFSTPTAKTPKGRHVYFKYHPDFSNAVRLVSEIDVRNNGGYVVAPPSKNGQGAPYEWFQHLSFSEASPQEMPSMLMDILLQSSPNKIDSISSSIEPNRYQQPTTQNNIDNILVAGRRDNDIFHAANCLIKGGMKKELIHKYLEILAKNCSPPFPEKEILIKINSALQRSYRRDGASMAEVREWVETTTGNFSATDVLRELTITTKEEKKKIRVYLSRLVNEGILEKHGRRDGGFVRVDDEAPDMDIFNVDYREFPIKMPLELHELVVTRPKNIIVIAGEKNAGKTAFCLTTASLNANRPNLEVRYFSSEMGPHELIPRLKAFEPEVPFENWKGVNFKEKSANFHTKLLPDGLNIIDFLEITDDFYRIGTTIREIYDKLNEGVAVIAIQKDPKKERGRGAEFSAEKSRLYVTLSSNPPEGQIAKITDAKNWRNPKVNPNRKEVNFNIINGSFIRMVGRWCKV